MVDWEENLRWSIVRTNSDVSRGNGGSTLHSQPDITCRKPRDLREERSETEFVTLICDLVLPLYGGVLDDSSESSPAPSPPEGWKS